MIAKEGETKILNLVVSTVPVHGLTHLGAETSAATVMTGVVLYIITWLLWLCIFYLKLWIHIIWGKKWILAWNSLEIRLNDRIGYSFAYDNASNNRTEWIDECDMKHLIQTPCHSLFHCPFKF